MAGKILGGVLCVVGLGLQGCGDSAAPTPAPADKTTKTTTTSTTTFTGTTTAAPENPWCTMQEETEAVAVPADGEPIGWNPTGQKVATGKWCEVGVPAKDWNLKNYCPKKRNGGQIKVLTYNLEWWHPFTQNGNKLMPGIPTSMADDDKVHPFDLMGFQECEQVDLVLKEAQDKGLSGKWKTQAWSQHAIALAYNEDTFDFISQGQAEVAEDRGHPGEKDYFGKRGAMWARLTHKATKTPIFYINHHGPTPVNTGGNCGNKATAYNILKVIAENAKVGDQIFMTCDCNAWSIFQGKYLEEIGTLACHLPHTFTVPTIESVWGIDNHFANCAKPIKKTQMDKGGSDHFPFSVLYDMGSSEAEEEAKEEVVV